MELKISQFIPCLKAGVFLRKRIKNGQKSYYIDMEIGGQNEQ